MKGILMYISMVIKVMILIVLIIILTKINLLSSSVKTIENFDNYKLPSSDPRGDKTLTIIEYNNLNNNNTYETNVQNEYNKNNKLQSITYSEIKNIIATFTDIAIETENDIKNLLVLAKPFPEKIYTFKRFPSQKILTMDKTKILDYVKTINDNLDTIKIKTNNIVSRGNRVRYIFYNYYTSYWNSYFTSEKRENNEVYSLYNELNELLFKISSAEKNAIDLYLYAKGFITMKEGTDIYKYYKDALESKPTKIYNDFNTEEISKDKIGFLFVKKDYKYNCCNTTTEKNKEYNPNNLKNFESNYGESYYYTWKVFDYKSGKYVAEGERPKNVILKDGSSCNYQPRDCNGKDLKNNPVNCRNDEC